MPDFPRQPPSGRRGDHGCHTPVPTRQEINAQVRHPGQAIYTELALD